MVHLHDTHKNYKKLHESPSKKTKQNKNYMTELKPLQRE